MLTVGDQTFEWDENKRAINFAQHGLDFGDLAFLDWDGATIYESDRAGEPRWIAFLFGGTEFFAVVYTIREEHVRVISFRRARQEEEHKYATAQTRSHLTD